MPPLRVRELAELSLHPRLSDLTGDVWVALPHSTSGGMLLGVLDRSAHAWLSSSQSATTLGRTSTHGSPAGADTRGRGAVHSCRIRQLEHCRLRSCASRSGVGHCCRSPRRPRTAYSGRPGCRDAPEMFGLPRRWVAGACSAGPSQGGPRGRGGTVAGSEGSEVERFPGHLIHMALLHRTMLSLYHACYDFIHTVGRCPVRRWASVVRECRWISTLLPLVRADPRSAWSSSVIGRGGGGGA